MQVDTYQYIPPNEATAPRHAAVRAAQQKCISVIICPRDFAAVADACRTFAAVCAAVAPRSADLTTAERCIRLARMLSNEAVAAAAKSDAIGSGHLISEAIGKLREARMWTCAAIALADAGELPAWET